MNYQVVQINENTWRIEDGGVRFFLLEGGERALLIDSGMTAPDAREVAEELTDRPISLLNTHSDRDHTAGNERFGAFYMHPADEANYRQGGRGGQIMPIGDGDGIELGGRPLQIIHLPGHTPGSVAVLDVNHRVLISGDPIQEHGRIFMFGPHRDMETYIRSLERLEKRADEFDEIWPSHADIPLSPSVIARLKDGARDVLEGRAQGSPMEMHGRSVVAYDLGFTTFLCDQ